MHPSAPNLTPSSITKIANACAATLSPAHQSREAFSVLATFIPKFTRVCFSDLRLACIFINDHELFTQLKLGHVINPKDESLRRCPPDEVQVYYIAWHTPKKNEFLACFRIRMLQKRLGANPTQELDIESIAGGTGHTFSVFLVLIHLSILPVQTGTSPVFATEKFWGLVRICTQKNRTRPRQHHREMGGGEDTILGEKSDGNKVDITLEGARIENILAKRQGLGVRGTYDRNSTFFLNRGFCGTKRTLNLLEELYLT
ncbi:hypothetical protein BD769DRAFT_1774377 [Suillus cothurnatus]|nr:hypothetical protein BD769DRAFT_1774377 [Suillus cothurnatus]